MKTNLNIYPLALTAFLILLATPASAVVFSYTNADGEYVVSEKPPKDKTQQYAVLSDEGAFIRLVTGRNNPVPISHWRPWYLPKEPHPFDADPELIREREPVVTVEEESK